MDEGSARLLMNCKLWTVTHEMNSVLEEPISLDELQYMISKGKPHKAPGHDGRGLRFYKMAWEVMKLDLLQIINCMYSDGIILEKQLQGIIACIPKHTHPTKGDKYRPLTLMNTDYKIIARIIVERLKPVLSTLLHPNQYCGLHGNSMFDAMAAVQDVIAFAEIMRKPVCVVSIDFSATFDKISHEYLQEILSPHGFSVSFIHSTYNEAV